MGDLHSIAECNGSLHSSSLDFSHNLGVFNADMSRFMDDSTPPFFSPFDSVDLSTGYLQDALFEFSSKRRRLLLFNYDDDQTKNYFSTDPVQNYWKNMSYTMDSYEDVGSLSQITSSHSGEVTRRIGEEVSIYSEMKAAEEADISTSETIDSSSSSQKHSSNPHSFSDKDTLYSIDPLYPFAGGVEKSKKRTVTRVVYPFAVVKPGGVEGDVTINDINERLLMPPTRPVKHPVGDFACRPLVSPDGPGLSGKAVVALKRIHTQGRGTITIIRTRG